MERTKTVFKRHEVQVGGPAEPKGSVRPPRIPGRHVHAEGFAEAPSVPEPRVLRGPLVRGAVAPYVMAELDHEPSFPLPEAEPPEDADRAADGEGPSLDPDEREAAWQARLDEAVEQARADAYAEGYEQGYVAAEASLQASFEQRKVELENDVVRLKDAWRDFLKESEPLMAALAFDVARQLLDAPLPEDVRSVSAQALAEAIDRFGAEATLEIALHPDDLSRLRALGLIDDLEALRANIRWDPNPNSARGDWIVQSPDAALRWLKDELLEHLKGRLGLLPVMKSREASGP